MTKKRVRLLLVFGLLLRAATHLNADALYRVTELGMPDGSGTSAYAINEAGQVTGESNGHAFLYSNGQMTDLGTLGGLSSDGRGINDAGQVVGHFRYCITRRLPRLPLQQGPDAGPGNTGDI